MEIEKKEKEVLREKERDCVDWREGKEKEKKGQINQFTVRRS